MDALRRKPSRATFVRVARLPKWCWSWWQWFSPVIGNQRIISYHYFIMSSSWISVSWVVSLCFFSSSGSLVYLQTFTVPGGSYLVRWSNSRLTKVADRNSHRWCFSLVIYCVYIYIYTYQHLPQGWCIGTAYHPFSTPWKIQVHTIYDIYIYIIHADSL